ncbi:MAG TPA: CARDB domain-containing protein, partial [Solirubrobacteraceae bacterium]
PADRAVSVRAVMRPVTGTQKMQMRFELLTSPSLGAPFVEVPGGRLDSWISPADPTLGQHHGDVWLVPDHVRNLPAPGYYRYRVSFRWIGIRGRVLATRTRSSSDCFQPLLRPDLLVSTIALAPSPTKSTKDLYVATIANDGNAPTPVSFTVAFTHPAAAGAPGAAPVTFTKTMQRLAPGATGQVTFDGPVCSAATAPTVLVDPDDSVDESNFSNNSLTVNPSCPAVTAAPTPTPASGS